MDTVVDIALPLATDEDLLTCMAHKGDVCGPLLVVPLPAE
jgi:hypothetical protein